MGKNFAVENFSWAFYRDPSTILLFKYQRWYLTPSCGIEVQKPIQALKSFNGLGEYLWSKPQVGKNFAVGNFSWDIYRGPHKTWHIQLWYLNNIMVENGAGGGGGRKGSFIIIQEKFPTAKFLPTWGLSHRYILRWPITDEP